MAEEAAPPTSSARTPAARADCSSASAAGHPRPALNGCALVRLRAARGRDRRRPRARQDRAVPGRDRRRGGGAGQPADDRHDRRPADPAAVARPRRPHLVGQRHPRDREVDRRAGHEPHELDAAHRGHRRAVRPAAGRADPALPRRVGAGRLGAHAARLGVAQHHPARHRRGPRALRPRDRQRHARTRSASSTAASRGSARATSASPMRSPPSSRRTPPSRPPTPCSSPCRTNSASSTTPGCSRRSPSTWRPRSAGSRRAEADAASASRAGRGAGGTARDAVRRRGGAQTRRPA